MRERESGGAERPGNFSVLWGGKHREAGVSRRSIVERRNSNIQYPGRLDTGFAERSRVLNDLHPRRYHERGAADLGEDERRGCECPSAGGQGEE